MTGQSRGSRSILRDKILSRRQLLSCIRQIRAGGKTIVTTNGSFDILHAGHLFLLERAKEYGDILIVGLNSDSSIRRYKSPLRPIIPERFRAKLLAAIQFVDYVHLFAETDPIRFLRDVKPDVHVNSAQYGRDCIEAPVVKDVGGRLVLIPVKTNLLSTSTIIDSIIKKYEQKT